MPAQSTPTSTDAALRAAFADGPLGILVTHAEAGPLLDGLLAQAAALGIDAAVFFMDEGTRLLADHAFIDALPDAAYSACDLSVRARAIDPPERVNVAGQFHNAMMVCDAARVVTL